MNRVFTLLSAQQKLHEAERRLCAGPLTPEAKAEFMTLADLVAMLKRGEIPPGFELVRCPCCSGESYLAVGGRGPVFSAKCELSFQP